MASDSEPWGLSDDGALFIFDGEIPAFFLGTSLTLEDSETQLTSATSHHTNGARKLITKVKMAY